MGILDTLQQESTISKASGNNYQYVVLHRGPRRRHPPRDMKGSKVCRFIRLSAA